MAIKNRVNLALVATLSLACIGCSGGNTAADEAEQPVQVAQSADEESQTEQAQPSEGGGTQGAEVQSQPEEYVDAEHGCGTYVGTAPDAPQPYVKEACWWTSTSQTGTFINIAALMGNTDQVNCYTFPKVRCTAYSEDGTILDTQEITSQFIAPADVMPCLTTMSVASKPARVEFDISFREGSVPGHPYTLASFDIQGANEQQADNFIRWTGQYTNGCGVGFEYGCEPVVLLRRDGALVAGYHELSITEVPDGATVPFSVDSGVNADVPEHNSFDVYIVPKLMP